MAGSAVGAAASATGSTVSGLVSTAGQASGATADIAQYIADRFGLITQLTASKASRRVLAALRESNIKELQPGLKSRAETVTKGVDRNEEKGAGGKYLPVTGRGRRGRQ